MLNHNVRGRGTYHRCMAYARQLVKRGHRVDVVTISPTNRLTWSNSIEDGVRILESPDFCLGAARSGWDPWDTVSRIAKLWHGRYDIVHGFDGRPAVRYPARFFQRRGVPYISDWADWWGRGGVISERSGLVSGKLFAPIETYFEESCRPLADHVTVISSALAARARGLGIPPERLTRIPGGAEPERIRPIDKLVARRTVSIGGGELVVCYAGFVQYDIDFILASFSRLHELNPRARLLLIGPRVDERIDRLTASVREAIWQTGVLPSQTELNTHVSAADVLLLPFQQKIANIGRWPNKASEYMCLGRPIVTNPVGDVVELIEAGAAVSSSADPNSVAQVVADLFSQPDLMRQIGMQARYAAETVFNYENRVGLLESVYQRYVRS